MSTMKISRETKVNNKLKNHQSYRGPLDKFLTREEMKEDSLTLSDFDCDSVDLDLSDIVNRIIT